MSRFDLSVVSPSIIRRSVHFMDGKSLWFAVPDYDGNEGYLEMRKFAETAAATVWVADNERACIVLGTDFSDEGNYISHAHMIEFVEGRCVVTRLEQSKDGSYQRMRESAKVFYGKSNSARDTALALAVQHARGIF